MPGGAAAHPTAASGPRASRRPAARTCARAGAGVPPQLPAAAQLREVTEESIIHGGLGLQGGGGQDGGLHSSGTTPLSSGSSRSGTAHNSRHRQRQPCEQHLRLERVSPASTEAAHLQRRKAAAQQARCAAQLRARRGQAQRARPRPLLQGGRLPVHALDRQELLLLHKRHEVSDHIQLALRRSGHSAAAGSAHTW